MKTNATRYLDSLGIQYQLLDYEVDPDDLSAVKVAAQIGMPARQVFKTLLAKGDRVEHLFAVIPGDLELDLKSLARASGNRSVELVPLNQLQQLTGYIRGGVTVFAAKRRFPAFIDSSSLSHPTIAVSAGVRGTQIQIAPADYIRAAAAITAELVRVKPKAES